MNPKRSGVGLPMRRHRVMCRRCRHIVVITSDAISVPRPRKCRDCGYLKDSELRHHG